MSAVVMRGRYGSVGGSFSDDVPSALTPMPRDAVVSHQNFPEFVTLTVKKQLETNLLPMIAHVKTAFEAVVPAELRMNLAPQQLRCASNVFLEPFCSPLCQRHC
jgi:hypothetical protein